MRGRVERDDRPDALIRNTVTVIVETNGYGHDGAPTPVMWVQHSDDSTHGDGWYPPDRLPPGGRPHVLCAPRYVVEAAYRALRDFFEDPPG